jgi:hypothetical protein
MATKKKGKKATKSKPTSAKKVTSTRRVAKKHVPTKPTPKKKGRAASSKKTLVTDTPLRRKVTRRSSARETTVFEPATGRSRSGGQSGDLQGLRDVESADSESVNELLEEGNAFEADVVAGVEHVEDDEEREVHTHEVPEDDVPQEYLDKDE